MKHPAAMSLPERQLELARAVVARIRFGRVEREGSEWTIAAPLPVSSNRTAGVTLDLGNGPETPVEVSGATFDDSLRRAASAGMGQAKELQERYAELLRAWQMERF